MKLEQAKRLGQRLENTRLDIIYSSPLGRAIKTAKIVMGKKDIPIVCDDRLKEIKKHIPKRYQDNINHNIR